MQQSPARPDTGLPPTPPSNMQGLSSPEVEHQVPAYADGVVSSLMSQKSGLSTPINQRSPPTPETTPPQNPNLLSVSRPSIASHTPSSFAGSFKTAQESQSIDDNESHRYAPSEASTRSLSGAWSHSAGRVPGRSVPEIGLGLNFEYLEGEATSVESTPGERYPSANSQHQSHVAEEIENARQYRNEHVQDPEWDDGQMRNATLRKRQPRGATTQLPKSDQDNMENYALDLEDQANEQVPQTECGPRSPTMTKPANVAASSSPVHRSGQGQRDEQKRLSSASHPSNVVEAMVVPSPVAAHPQHRALRRMGKNLSLRNGDRLVGSPSTRNSQTSEDLPPHRLVHKKSPIPDRKTRDSNGSVISSRAVSSPEHLRPDSAPTLRFPRPPSAPKNLDRHPKDSQKTSWRVKQLPSGLDRVGLGYFDISKYETLPANNAPRKNEGRPRDSIPTIRATAFDHDLTLANDEATSFITSPKIATSDTPEQQPPLAKARLQSLTLQDPVNGWQRHELDEELQSDDPGLPIMGTRLDGSSVLESGRRSLSLDNSPNLRGQLDRLRPSHETAFMPRSSADYLLAPHSDHSLARHIRASASPHSEGSADQTDTLEVSEATAVSIYPHTNNSLLVVQQLARPVASDAIQRRRTISSIRSGASSPNSRSQPQLVPSFTTKISPSTPPTNTLIGPDTKDSGSRNFDSYHLSPSKVSRIAPQPPVFKIIPPTPLSEIETPLSPTNPNATAKVTQLTGPGVPTNASHAIQNAPVRRLSLRQRARRLSEPIIQPLLQAKAQLPLSGNKNRYNLHVHPPSVPSVSDIPQENNKLHPFWRPRGFWDDFSDSGSEDDEYAEDEEEPGFFVAGRHVSGHAHVSPFIPFDPELDRLPEGGDTSNVNPSPHNNNLLGFSGGSLSRRIGSLRSGFAGAGGFLIGNSLGIGRHPSNSRRHVVHLPASLRARLAATDGVQKRRSLSTSSRTDGSTLYSTSVRRIRQRKGLIHKTRLGVKNNRRLTLERIFVRHKKENEEDTNALGFRVPNRFAGVRDRVVGLRKENKRRKSKRTIGNIELVQNGQVAPI